MISRSVWAGLMMCCNFYVHVCQKRTETSLHKKISKNQCRDGSMNALADEVHKQGMPHSDMHSKTWPHYSTTIPTYM